jgi:hypothetical protein
MILNVGNPDYVLRTLSILHIYKVHCYHNTWRDEVILPIMCSQSTQPNKLDSDILCEH